MSEVRDSDMNREECLRQMAEALDDEAEGLSLRCSAVDAEAEALRCEIEARQTEVNRMQLKLEYLNGERRRLLARIAELRGEAAVMREPFDGAAEPQEAAEPGRYFHVARLGGEFEAARRPLYFNRLSASELAK